MYQLADMVQKRSLPRDRNPLVEPEHTPQCKSGPVAVNLLRSTVRLGYSVNIEKQATNWISCASHSGNTSGASQTWTDPSLSKAWANRHVKCDKNWKSRHVRLCPSTSTSSKGPEGFGHLYATEELNISWIIFSNGVFTPFSLCAFHLMDDTDVSGS